MPFCSESINILFPGTVLKKGMYLNEWKYISDIRSQWKVPAGKKTLEAQLMDLCDDIAYSAHDLEDGIKAGKIEVHEHFMHDDYIQKLIVEKITTLEDYFWLSWETDRIRAKVEEVLNAFLRVWKEKLPTCDNDYSQNPP
jgi:dGTPase